MYAIIAVSVACDSSATSPAPRNGCCARHCDNDTFLDIDAEWVKCTPFDSETHMRSGGFKGKRWGQRRIQKFWKGRGRAKYNVSAPSSFIANAHYKLYAFLYGKKAITEQKFWNQSSANVVSAALILPLWIRHWCGGYYAYLLTSIGPAFPHNYTANYCDTWNQVQMKNIPYWSIWDRGGGIFRANAFPPNFDKIQSGLNTDLQFNISMLNANTWKTCKRLTAFFVMLSKRP